MKRNCWMWMTVILLLSVLATACQPQVAVAPEAPVAEAPEEAGVVEEVVEEAAEEPVLAVIGSDGETVELTMSELQALNVTSGQAGMVSSTGAITPPVEHKGVSLKDLVELVGGMDETMGIYLEAEDGYGITFSYDQVMSGDFIAYDPVTAIELETAGPLTAIVAYERDGKPLDPVQDGTLRLVAVSPEADQIVDGHWMVKWLVRVEVKPAAAVWYLHLEGALTEEMDRATFESGSSPHCHLKSWTDEDGSEWMGMPLWYLVGRVDDEIRHESRAFDEDLAETGYKVSVVAADGFTVDLESQDIAFNDELIVASQINGEPLDDKYYPLRLVGEGLSKAQMVGAIESILLDLEPIEEPAAEAAAPGDAPAAVEGDLVIIGSVETPTGLMIADLEAMEQTEASIMHPKKEELQDYKGILLSELFALAKPAEDAETMVITAGDGYQSEVPAADALACEECMLAVMEGGGYMSVMPGFESSAWVKDVVSLEFVGGTAREMTGDFVISGNVEFTMPFTYAEIAEMEMVTINTKHPKKDELVDYTGVRLNDLLAMAKPKTNAQKVKLVAGDGYTIELPLADLTACKDCLLAFDDDGTLKSVMPGMESMFWAKDLVQVVVE